LSQAPAIEGVKRGSLLHWLKNSFPNKMRQLFPKQKGKHTHKKNMPNVSHCFDEEENEEKL